MGNLSKRAFCTARLRSVRSLALAVLVTAGLFGTCSSAFAEGAQAGTVGSYEVQVPSGGAWTTVGTAAFGFEYTTQSVALPGTFRQLRLVQHGGTAAQIDGVSLAGEAPMAVFGSADTLALQKLQAADHDVTNVFDQALILTFPTAGSRLELNARVQGDISGAFPFEFPGANTYEPVGPDSKFYSYRVGDLPTAIDTGAKPFVDVLCEPATGHPDGNTYVWVASDRQNLLVTVDFTPDNTMDGNEDYAAVHVKTPAGVKEFKISTAQQAWGDVAFTYTDKVSYQHKLYSFRIPWSEVGVGSDKIEVAFTAYGTAAVAMPVYRFYNKMNGSHFYTANAAEKASVIANLSSTYNYEGVAYSIRVFDPNNNDPLYRFYAPRLGSHFYTVSEAEKASVIANLSSTYTFEGVAYDVCVPDVFGSTNIYRFYNRVNGSHFYTASLAERDAVLNDASGTYAYEGVGFHVIQ